MSIYKTIGLHPHKCGICGKEFECRTEYVYKKRKKRSKAEIDYFCSYHCYVEAEKSGKYA